MAPAKRTTRDDFDGMDPAFMMVSLQSPDICLEVWYTYQPPAYNE